MPYLLAVGLVACTASEEPRLAVTSPYREPNDLCRSVAPTPDTVELIREGSDLVACPKGYDGLPMFIEDVGAEELGQLNGWYLYRVPQPWRG